MTILAQIPLQNDIIYGPVFSRRLGRSLGINLLPTTYKSCSFDCIYCQYGSTFDITLSPKIGDLPTTTQVLDSVEKALKKPRTLDTLTFSGNGEPSIHPDFPLIVRCIKDIRDHLKPNAKLAILSNSSSVMNPQVLSTLRLFDAPMMKLDAGDEDTFRAINKPVESIHLEEIINGLKSIPNLIIQSALIDGDISNVKGEAYKSWVAILREIMPTKVHIYSAERPTADDRVICVSPKKLVKIKEELNNQFGLDVEVFWSDDF